MADRDGAARRPLVGRAGEIDALNSLLRAAAHGEPGALLISGEAGVGKTALAREVTAGSNVDADVNGPFPTGAVPKASGSSKNDAGSGANAM